MIKIMSKIMIKIVIINLEKIPFQEIFSNEICFFLCF